MIAPLLSIVVPTEGRPAEVTSLIASLQASRSVLATESGSGRPGGPIELLIVDSTTPPLPVTTMPGWDASWMRVCAGTRNVRQKRNLGVNSARAPWIAFVDSDCVVSPAYVGAVLRATQATRANGFAGRVEFHGSDNRIWRAIASSQLASPQTQTSGEGEIAWCATANLIVKRELFLAVGGFDETLPFRLGGDDVDFGLRLKKCGQALRVLPDALVIHPKAPWSRLAGIIPRTWRWGRVEYHLAQRHRDRVRMMPPYFIATILTFTLACVVGAVLTGRAALLALPPVWVVATTALATLLTPQKPHSFADRYAGGWLNRLYHAGCAWEHVNAGSPRFLWEALILEDRMEFLFPSEPIQAWCNIITTIALGLVGIPLVRP